MDNAACLIPKRLSAAERQCPKIVIQATNNETGLTATYDYQLSFPTGGDHCLLFSEIRVHYLAYSEADAEGVLAYVTGVPAMHDLILVLAVPNSRTASPTQ